MRTQGGYTLLELLVATGVALVLVGAAVTYSVSVRQDARNHEMAGFLGSVLPAFRSYYTNGYDQMDVAAVVNGSPALRSAFRPDPFGDPSEGGSTGWFEVGSVLIRVLPGSEIRGAGGLPQTAAGFPTMHIRVSRISPSTCTDLGRLYLPEAQVVRVHRSNGSAIAVRTDAEGIAGGSSAALAAACGHPNRVLDMFFY